MGKLEKLEEELYEGEDKGLAKRMSRRVIFPKSLQKLSTVWREEKSPSVPEKYSILSDRKLLKIFLSVLGVALALLGAAFLFLFLGTRGQEAKITIHDRGPIEAGEFLTIPIAVKNTSQTTLKEAELALVLPEGSLLVEGGADQPVTGRIVKKMADLPSGREEVLEFTVRLFGSEGEGKKVEATLLYRPENLRARFSARGEKIFKISRVPLALSWDLPEILSQGQEVTARARYSSSASRAFQNMWLRVEYPPGFSFKSGDPKPDVGDTIWNLGTLESGKEGVITLRGIVSGEEGEIKSLRGELGVFNPLTKEWKPYLESSQPVKIAVTPLSLQMSLGGSRNAVISPGDRLEFSVRYKNNTDGSVKNISIRTYAESDLLNFASLSVEKGVFDFASQRIVWSPATAGELREVAPGAGGELHFSIGTKENPVVRSSADRNLVIKVSSTLVPGIVPEKFAGTDLSSSDALEFKVRSKIVLAGKALHRSSPIFNSGPLPPKVGQETEYTILWEVRNFTNNLQDAEMVSLLPPNIKWKANFFPKDARITYDPISGEVRWRIGEIKVGVGVITPALTLAFQVSAIPAEADEGKIMTLLGPSRLNAKDTFTEEAVSKDLASITAELREDAGTTHSDWTVTR